MFVYVILGRWWVIHLLVNHLYSFYLYASDIVNVCEVFISDINALLIVLKLFLNAFCIAKICWEVSP